MNIIVNIEAGERACSQCLFVRESIENQSFECACLGVKMGRDDWDGCRLPACLAAEREYNRLKEGGNEHNQ